MESQSQAINIPSRADPHPEDIGNFVGSPEPLSDSILAQSTPRVRHPTQHGNTLTSSRPGFFRSISSPHPPSRGRESITSSLTDVTHSLFGGGRRERWREQEWTVFGQLMGGDDDTRGYTSASPRSRGFDRRRNVASPSRSGASPSPVAERRSMLEDSIHSPGIEPLNASWTDRSFLTSSTAQHGPVIEEDLEEDSDSEDEHTVRAPSPHHSRWFPSITLPTLTPLQRNILKCSIAYFLGSLFTFSPYLSGFLADLTNYGTGDKSPSPVGHIVATVCVYLSAIWSLTYSELEC